MKNDKAGKNVNIPIENLRNMRTGLIYDIADMERARRDNKTSRSYFARWFWNTCGTGFWLSILSACLFVYGVTTGAVVNSDAMALCAIMIAAFLANGIDGTTRKVAIRDAREEKTDSILERNIRNSRIYLKYVEDILTGCGEVYTNTEDEIVQRIKSADKDR